MSKVVTTEITYKVLVGGLVVEEIQASITRTEENEVTRRS